VAALLSELDAPSFNSTPSPIPTSPRDRLLGPDGLGRLGEGGRDRPSSKAGIVDCTVTLGVAGDVWEVGLGSAVCEEVEAEVNETDFMASCRGDFGQAMWECI